MPPARPDCLVQASSRMREERSLTEAVKDAAGVSLTEAVRGVTGRREWVVDVALEALDDIARSSRDYHLRRLRAGCARLAAIAVLCAAIVCAGSTGIGSDRAPRAILQKRVALVIGNSAYRNTPRLENPRNDATDMGAALTRLGFHVIAAFDLDKAAFEKAIADFAAALEGADTALLFYAGHGLLVSGQNYLVPVDAKLTSLPALDTEMVRLEVVQRLMERRAKVSLLFFDACRDNPLARSLARAMGTSSLEVGRGLAAVGGGVGTLISFASEPEKVAYDGKGRNSPYSGALVRHLRKSTDDLSAILIAARKDVMRETEGKQVPWEHSALTGRYYFNRAAQAPSAEPMAQSRSSEAAEAWSAVKDATNVAVLRVFVARYGDTFFAELARARIEELERLAAASASARQVRDPSP
jgi:uncharacterized caspase-like protein